MANITDKIQKLLNLAGNNPNEQEAKAALLKAQELMAQYNIDMDGLHKEEKIVHKLVSTAVKAHKLNNALAVVIADSFACKTIIVDGKLSFFGREDNAEASASAFSFAFKAMKRGGDKATRDNGYQPGHNGAAHYYNSYVLGFIHGLKKAMDAQTVALAVVVPQDVKDKFDERFKERKYYHSSKTKAAYGREAYNAGMRDGSRVMDKRSLNA